MVDPIFLAAETPNAGRRGYRFLVSEGAPSSDREVAACVAPCRATAEADVVGASFVGVRRKVTQRFSGRTGADEILVVAGVDPGRLGSAGLRVLLDSLRNLLQHMDTASDAIAWETEQRLVVPSDVLTGWLNEQIRPLLQRHSGGGGVPLRVAVAPRRGVLRRLLTVLAVCLALALGVGLLALWAQNSNRAHLQSIEAGMAEGADLQRLDSLVTRLEQAPYPWLLGKGDLSDQQRLRASLNERREVFLADQAEQTIRTAAEREDWERSIELIAQIQDNRPRFDRVRSDLRSRLTAAAIRLTKSKREEGHSFKAARQALDKEFPRKMFEDALGAGYLNDAIKELDELEDRHLYDRVRGCKELDSLTERAEAYLASDVKSKRMEKEVKQLRDYLATASAPAAITVSLVEIEWGEDCWEGENNLELFAEVGGKRIDTFRTTVNAEQKRTANLKSQRIQVRFQAKPRDRIRIVLDLKQGITHHNGKIDESKELREWRTCSIHLKAEASLRGKAPKGNRVTLQVDGVRTTPDLPKWEPRPQ